MTRQRIFGFIAILCFFALWGCTDTSNTFSFVFMTDIHVQPERRADEGFTAAIQRVNQIAPDFVLTGGDLIMDALGQTYGRADSLYDMYNGLTSMFDMPVYNTLGNHEVFGLYTESGISPQHAEYGKAMYLKNMGYEQTYYSFDYKGWHFIVLDCIGYTPERHYFGQIDSVQMVWLQGDLRTVNPETPIVLSTHIPFVSVYSQFQNSSTFAMTGAEIVVNAQEVLTLFDQHNLKLVLQGHRHEVEHIHFRNTHFITGGAVCGGWWKGACDGFPEGFIVVDVQDDSFEWRYETYGWQATSEESE